MKQRFLAGALVAVFTVGAQAVPLQTVQAAQVRVEETSQLLENAMEDMEEGNYVEGEAIVSMEATDAVALAREGTYRFDADVHVESVNAFGTDEESGKETYIVHLTSDKYTTEELMELALKQYYVDGVCANRYCRLCSTDPYRSGQWYLDGSGTQSEGIRLSQQSVTSKKTPVIAVLDTGVNYNHPDLAGSMWNNPYPDKLSGTYGYDFGDGDADPMDTNGHGTHVAGIAAAQSNNGIGITGISTAKIMAIKTCRGDSGEMTEAAIIDAYGYVRTAIEAGVNVKAVNCSWGGTYDTNGVIERAIEAVGELGVLSVFAAGNDHMNWDSVDGEKLMPFCFDSQYTVVVGASDEQDEASYFSDYGAKSVDVFAPGTNILSTYKENFYLSDIYDSDQQKELSVYFNRFSDTSENILVPGQTWKDFYTAQQLGLQTDYAVNVTSLKDEGNGYIKLAVSRNSWLPSAGSEIAGSIYVDVTELNLDQNATYYVAYKEGHISDGNIYWEDGNFVSSPDQSRFANKDGRAYMRIVGLTIPAAGWEYPLYLDDIAISVPNPDPEDFGAYVHYSGTSMSAPVVSGAVATLAAANPTLSATSLRSLLLKSVRKVSALSGKCITGGIIDTSKFATLATKVTLNKTSATLRYGKTLTLKAKVSPTYVTSTKVTWRSSNTKYATVSSKGVVKAKKAGIGHTVVIAAITADGTKKKAVCRVKLKK